jgi:MFS family permease
MKSQRWLRIIPVALIMYTISYVDRTNISLALEPKLSTLMRDLQMDDRMKGWLAGIFFFGYLTLQIPGGYWATRWGARRIVSIFLVSWGICAVGCGLSHTFRQFSVMRVLLGVAESGVFPATLVLLCNWFPRNERARANAYWILCQPLAVAGSAPITAALLGRYGWQKMLIIEGALPFIWLPIWWFFIRDHPREAKWISPQEREFLEQTLKKEDTELEKPEKTTVWSYCGHGYLYAMIGLYFLQNCAAYGCMTFLTTRLKKQGFSNVEYGLMFAGPYIVAAVLMILNSWHSDLTRERRGHVAAIYVLSGTTLILSVVSQNNFWLSYIFLCFAIPGPFAAQAPFWAIASETLPRSVVGMVMGLVNAFGNLGGFAGPYIAGALSKAYGGSTDIPFIALGVGLLICALLTIPLPKPARAASTSPAPS